MADVRLRKARPVYDALEAGNYKAALKLTAKKDMAKLPLLQALRAYALERTGRREEAIELAEEVARGKPSDENTVSALTSVFRFALRFDLTSHVYEHMCAANGSDVAVAIELFMCYVRELAFAKQQQHAMRMYKGFGESRFMAWAVVSLLLQHLPSRNRGADVDAAASPSAGSARALQLGQMMLHKVLAPAEAGCDSESLGLYLHLLCAQGKTTEALEALKGPLNRVAVEQAAAVEASEGDRDAAATAAEGRAAPAAPAAARGHGSSPGPGPMLLLDFLREEARLAVELGDWLRAHALFRTLLERGDADDWSYWLGLVDSAVCAWVARDGDGDTGSGDAAADGGAGGDPEARVCPTADGVLSFIHGMQSAAPSPGAGSGGGSVAGGGGGVRRRGPHLAELYLESRLAERVVARSSPRRGPGHDGDAAAPSMCRCAAPTDAARDVAVPVMAPAVDDSCRCRRLTDLLIAYVGQFGDKACCVADLDMFLEPFSNPHLLLPLQGVAGVADSVAVAAASGTSASATTATAAAAAAISPGAGGTATRSGQVPRLLSGQCARPSTPFAPPPRRSDGVRGAFAGRCSDPCKFLVCAYQRARLVAHVRGIVEASAPATWDAATATATTSAAAAGPAAPSAPGGEAGPAASVDSKLVVPDDVVVAVSGVDATSGASAATFGEKRALLRRYITAVQLLRALGELCGHADPAVAADAGHDARGCERCAARVSDMRAWAARLVADWHVHTRPLCAAVAGDQREVQLNDDLVLVAANLLHELAAADIGAGNDAAGMATLQEAAALLEAARVDSPFNFQFTLLLMNTYASVGAYPRVAALFKDLQVKNIQFETLSYTVLPDAVRLGFAEEARQACTNVCRVHDDDRRDVADALTVAFKGGNYSTVVDMVHFRRRMAASHQLAQAKTELAYAMLVDGLSSFAAGHELLRDVLLAGRHPHASVDLGDEELSRLTYNYDVDVAVVWVPAMWRRARGAARDRARARSAHWMQVRQSLCKALLWAAEGNAGALDGAVAHLRRALSAAFPEFDSERSTGSGEPSMSSVRQCAPFDATRLVPGLVGTAQALHHRGWRLVLLVLNACVAGIKGQSATGDGDEAAGPQWAAAAAALNDVSSSLSAFVADCVREPEWTNLVERGEAGPGTATAAGGGAHAAQFGRVADGVHPAVLASASVCARDVLPAVIFGLAVCVGLLPHAAKAAGKGAKGSKAKGGRAAGAAAAGIPAAPEIAAVTEAARLLGSACTKALSSAAAELDKLSRRCSSTSTSTSSTPTSADAAVGMLSTTPTCDTLTHKVFASHWSGVAEAVGGGHRAALERLRGCLRGWAGFVRACKL